MQPETPAILGEPRTEVDLAMPVISHDLSVVWRVADEGPGGIARSDA